MTTLRAESRFWRVPLDAARVRRARGHVYVLVDRCKGCSYCVEYCPREILVLSASYNARGHHPPEVKNPEDCVNCGHCELVCPEFAIFAVEVAA